MNKLLAFSIDLAKQLNELAESESWDFFDEGLAEYLEKIYFLEQAMSEKNQDIEGETLELISQLHSMILTHALARKEQLAGELLMLHKNKQVSSCYQQY